MMPWWHCVVWDWVVCHGRGLTSSLWSHGCLYSIGMDNFVYENKTKSILVIRDTWFLMCFIKFACIMEDWITNHKPCSKTDMLENGSCCLLWYSSSRSYHNDVISEFDQLLPTFVLHHACPPTCNNQWPVVLLPHLFRYYGIGWGSTAVLHMACWLGGFTTRLWLFWYVSRCCLHVQPWQTTL